MTEQELQTRICNADRACADLKRKLRDDYLLEHSAYREGEIVEYKEVDYLVLSVHLEEYAQGLPRFGIKFYLVKLSEADHESPQRYGIAQDDLLKEPG